MKTFEFNKKEKQFVLNAINNNYCININDVMALTTIKRHWLNDTIYVCKNYDTNAIYAIYKRKTKTNVATFQNEKEAYKFILML